MLPCPEPPASRPRAPALLKVLQLQKQGDKSCYARLTAAWTKDALPRIALPTLFQRLCCSACRGVGPSTGIRACLPGRGVSVPVKQAPGILLLGGGRGRPGCSSWRCVWGLLPLCKLLIPAFPCKRMHFSQLCWL